MKNLLSIRRLIKWLPLLLIVIYAWQILAFIFGNDYKAPVQFSIYPDSGYYEIDPNSIMATINQGNTNVFVPFSGNWDRDEPHYASITWSQADYLKIANAISLETWGEPLDLENWRVVFIGMAGDCNDDPQGFYTFQFSYYRPLGIKNWKRQYTTRLIEIYPRRGLARWGTDTILYTPLLFGWHGVDLTQFNIVADDAIQIAEENGGENARLESNNTCRIRLGMNQQSPLYFRAKWIVSYDGTDFDIHIDPYSGSYRLFGFKR